MALAHIVAVVLAVAHSASALRSIEPLLFSEVSLDDDSIQAKAASLNTYYMMDMLDPDRLIWTFRNNAKLPTPNQPYQGTWEDPNCEVRGQFTGHYLSALSFIYNATGALLVRADRTLQVHGDV